jgi:hypothetical protein
VCPSIPVVGEGRQVKHDNKRWRCHRRCGHPRPHASRRGDLRRERKAARQQGVPSNSAGLPAAAVVVAVVRGGGQSWGGGHRLRVDVTKIGEPFAAAKIVLRRLAHRVQMLDSEIAETDEQTADLIAETAPATNAISGVGTQATAQLLMTAGDNPHRISSEAALARLCATAAETAKPTPRSISSWSTGCAGTRPPAPMFSGAPPRERPKRRSSVASSVQSSARAGPVGSGATRAGGRS